MAKNIAFRIKVEIIETEAEPRRIDVPTSRRMGPSVWYYRKR